VTANNRACIAAAWARQRYHGIEKRLLAAGGRIERRGVAAQRNSRKRRRHGAAAKIS
jgi:hypothetical protein